MEAADHYYGQAEGSIATCSHVMFSKQRCIVRVFGCTGCHTWVTQAGNVCQNT